MTSTVTDPPQDHELRGASAFVQLHWLASGRIGSETLVSAYRKAIAQANPVLHAYVALDEGANAAAAASDERRRRGQIVGRLDGLAVAIKDNLDVAGLPTGCGFPPATARVAGTDAAAVARLRAAGAIVLGKTALDEAALGTRSASPHGEATRNPWHTHASAGGSSGGSAAAVAAGLCSFALGSDTLGSVRIPASHCGVVGMKPTTGEISTVGLARGARRLDCVGVLTRSVEDLTLALTVLDGFDPADPRSRRRRVPLASPDWEPGRLRSGVLPDLAALGVDAGVRAVFARALAALEHELGACTDMDFSDYEFARMRRAALLVMESELAADLAGAAATPSPRLTKLVDYARAKSAVDYAVADRLLDAARLKARRLFAGIDVLVCPTVPSGPPLVADPERANDADLTSFASLAGCPAISLPMGLLPDGLPAGLQLIGAPGSDLRLIELAGACASRLDALPAYPARIGG
jgi:aspartyl-tRNA(Asn)/glutamyl-tRNA(Gln) amidotransferase subunit A